MSTLANISGLSKYFSFPFQDAGWTKKLLICALLSFAGFIVPVVPHLALLGYAAVIAEKMIHEGCEPFLPEWNNWGQFFVSGLRLFGVSLVYTLPGVLLSVGSYGSIWIFTIIMAIMKETGREAPAWLSLFTMGWMGIFIIAMGLVMVFFLIVYFFLPPAMMHTAARSHFSAGFKVKEWWKILKSNLGGFLITYLLLWGIYQVFVIVYSLLYLSIVLCFTIPFVLSIMGGYITLVSFALLASVYREGAEKAGML